MNGLFTAAKELQDFCDRQAWRSCFIGGIAVQRWGEPRVTRDLDLTLLAGFGNEGHFADALLSAYEGRVEEAAAFARRNRVVLLRTSTGIGIDISLGALPFEERMIDRATTFSPAPGIQIRTCSGEDLIVMKLFASRPTDIRDAEAVAARHGTTLDWGYIEHQLLTLAETAERPELVASLARLRQRGPEQ